MTRAALLVLLPLGACTGEEPPSPPRDAEVSRYQIWKTVRTFHEAMDKAELSRMSDLLAPEASIYSGKEEFAIGSSALEEELTRRVEEIQSLETDTIPGKERIEFADKAGDVAICTYVANVGSKRGVITMVLRRSQDKWLITHIHDSWPASTE